MKKSPLKAIHQQCFDCIYDPAGGQGTKHEQTENCTAVNCALYDFRPKTSKLRRLEREAMVRAMSPEERAKCDEKTRIASTRARQYFHGAAAK